jgi:hypothetical protein
MNRLLLTLVPLAFLTTILGVDRPALAGASARLVYLRGPGAEACPGEASVRAAVRARLGYDPFFPWAHDALVVEVTGAQGTFRVDLKRVDDGNVERGTRTLTVKATDCGAVLEAMALTMSLVVDPASIVGASPSVGILPQDSPASAPSPSSGGTGGGKDGTESTPTREDSAPMGATSAAAPESPSVPASPPSRMHARMGAAMTGSAGAAMSPNAGVRLFVGAGWRALSIDAEGRYDFPATGTASGEAVTSWIAAVSAVPCAHIGPAFGCAVATLGTQAARGHQGAQTVWYAAGGRLGAGLPFGASWTLEGYCEVLGAVQNEVVVGTASPAQRFSAITGSVGAAVAWSFL